MTRSVCVPTPPGRTLVEILRERALDRPTANAFTYLVDGETQEIRWDYEQLDVRARSIAAHLQCIGAAGQRVLLLYPPGLDFIAGFFGCLYAGAVAVPIHLARPGRQLSHVLNIVHDTGAVAALTTAARYAELEAHIAVEAPLLRLHWLATDRIDPAQASDWLAADVNSESLAYIQYTSGSTGTPKGVMLSHGNVIANERMIAESFEHTERLIGLGWLPLHHDMGLIGIVLQTIYLGQQSVLMSPVSFLQRPIRWLQGISKYRVTTSGGPSFAYALCVREAATADLTGLDLSCWDVAFNGAEPVRADVLERFYETFAPFGFRRESFHPCYGMAEASLIVTGGVKLSLPRIRRVSADALERHHVVPCGDDAPDVKALVSCGRVLGDEDLRIVDPQTCRVCERDRVGEIWVAGRHVAEGYWRNAEATKQTFRAQLVDSDDKRYLRTGDLGFLHAGELFVTGRLKDVIIIRGRNHYPQDIERTVACCHPALEDGRGVAFSVDRAGEERLVVVQEVRRTFLNGLDAEEVLSRVRQAVAEQHDLEVDCVLLLRTGGVPTTTSGKVQRRASRERYLLGDLRYVARWQQPSEAESMPAPRARAVSSPAPSTLSATVVENWLVDRLASRLHIPAGQIDVRQPFARYGLDSVFTVRLAEELGDWLGRRLDPALAYQYPTIELLSRHLIAPLDADGPQASHAAQSAAQHEPIAIIGMGCRLPGADNPEAFWQLLRAGADAIGPIPEERRLWAGGRPDAWCNVAHARGGYLQAVDQFDPQFFSIAPREAFSMDPQQRLLLEVSWQALENAALAPDRLAGSQTGVFIGISTGDYSRLQLDHSGGVSAYAGTGHASSIAANRLSYILDLRGPSWAVDTGCSSSLVAVHQACQNLRHRECDLALAGGVNLILLPELTEAFSQAGMLADDGRCRTFSADADGYVRSEGCGVVVLKRLSDALRDGDRIAALILGTAVNQDGRSNGLTAPNGPSQQAVIHKAQQNAGILPDDVLYVEAHGTGTPLGDPIEFNALKKSLHSGQLRHDTCWVGSVKTNIGHLEAAAGIAGLMKTVLALQHEEIPPHLHLGRLNPNIQLDGSRLLIPTQRTAWPRRSRRRIAGVNSFGFGGTNCHVVVGEAPVIPRHANVDRPAHLLTISAKCEPALHELVRRFDRHLEHHPDLGLADLCHTANAGRAHFGHRIAVVAGSKAELRRQLQSLLAGETPERAIRQVVAASRAPKLACVCTGDGSLLELADPSLLADEPALRDTLRECDEALQDVSGQSFSNLLLRRRTHPGTGNPAVPRRAFHVALEYAWARLWQTWGVMPDVLAGVGAGELTAACLAGVFDLTWALRLAVAQAAVLEEGSQRSLELYQKRCEAIPYREPATTLLSGTIADSGGGVMASAAYWSRYPRDPLPWTTRADAVWEAGCRLVIEIGSRSDTPHPPSPSGQQPSRTDPGSIGRRWLSWPAQACCGWTEVLAFLADLYAAGASIDWHAIDRRFSPVKASLPGYPFQRKRYWFDMAAGDCTVTEPSNQPSALGSLLGSPHLLTPVDAADAGIHGGDVEGEPLESEQIELRIRATSEDGGVVGVITRLGVDVTERRGGDAVIGIASPGNSNLVRISRRLVTARPPYLTDADAATLPVAFLAASIALEEVVRIRAGSRLLIHGADRHQASASVRIAKHHGAEVVLATIDPSIASDPAFRSWVILDACSPRLAGEVHAALGGEPVDALVTYKPAALGHAVLSCLAPGGQLIAVGAVSPQEAATMVKNHTDVWLSTVDPMDAIKHESALVQHILARLEKVWTTSGRQQSRGTELPTMTAPDTEFVQRWQQAATEDRRLLLSGYLRQELAALLGLDVAQVDPDESLTCLGIDSLMAFDLRNRLRSAVGISVPASTLIGGTSLSDLSDQLMCQWHALASPDVLKRDPGHDQGWIEGEL
jgi:acyl transferase domain-containing protein/acyl-CoA synthetase (AMP-forming)/AMP-acid ligase II/acyl carrier protein